MRKLTIAPVLVVPFLACGGDDGNSKVTLHDAKTFLDSGEVPCEAQDSYSMFLGSNGPSIEDHAAHGSGSAAVPQYQLVRGTLYQGSDSLHDNFFAELDAGSGSGLFPNGLVAGGPYSFDSSTNGNVLEALMLLLPAIGPTSVDGSGDLTDDYIENHTYVAFAASVTFTSEVGSNTGSGSGSSATAGLVSGEFENLEMVHSILTLNANGGITGATAADDSGSGASCAVTITSLPFSAQAKVGTGKYAVTFNPSQASNLTTHLVTQHGTRTLSHRFSGTNVR